MANSLLDPEYLGGVQNALAGLLSAPKRVGNALLDAYQTLTQPGRFDQVAADYIMDTPNRISRGIPDPRLLNPYNTSPEAEEARRQAEGLVLGFAAPIAKVTTAPTKYELAHKVAQKNATEMLGLPADNTAMDRARAMGFNGGYWHETSPTNLESMNSFSVDPSLAKAAAGDEQTPYAVFLKRHGRNIGVTPDPVQMPLMVKTGREVQYADRDALERSLTSSGKNAEEIRNAIDATKYYDREMGRTFDATFKGGDYDFDAADKMLAAWDVKNKENAAIAKRLITDRFNNGGPFHSADTIRILNDAGSLGRKVDTTMVMNPVNIRSRFAAFDPARANEADLLGNADPRLLAILAGGAGIGGYLNNR